MTISAKTLIASRYALNVANTEYVTPTGGRAIIDKFTATNTDSGAQTITVNLVAFGDSANGANTITKAFSIGAGVTAELTELKNHILSSQDFISVTASASSKMVIRASGREIT